MQKVRPKKTRTGREKRRRILENSLPEAIYHGPTNVYSGLVTIPILNVL